MDKKRDHYCQMVSCWSDRQALVNWQQILLPFMRLISSCLSCRFSEHFMLSLLSIFSRLFLYSCRIMLISFYTFSRRRRSMKGRTSSTLRFFYNCIECRFSNPAIAFSSFRRSLCRLCNQQVRFLKNISQFFLCLSWTFLRLSSECMARSCLGLLFWPYICPIGPSLHSVIILRCSGEELYGLGLIWTRPWFMNLKRFFQFLRISRSICPACLSLRMRSCLEERAKGQMQLSACNIIASKSQQQKQAWVDQFISGKKMGMGGRLLCSYLKDVMLVAIQEGCSYQREQSICWMGMIVCSMLGLVGVKKGVVLNVSQGDRLDFPAGVIRSLFQADSFPCSVASLGRPNLFKALDPSAYAEKPMATRNLIRAPGKREISVSPLPLITSIQPRCRFTGYTQALAIARGCLNTLPIPHLSVMGPARPGKVLIP